MYDIGRGAFLTPQALKEIILHAAKSGFTHFIPYLETMIRLPSTERACPNSAYTSDEWKDFEKTAVSAGIELVPHFNVIGHSTDICREYPELTGADTAGTDTAGVDSSALRLDPAYYREIDPLISESQTWMIRCLEEYCSFSNGKYFLIGGDEWNAPRHLLADPSFDPGKAWAEYINIAVDYLHEKGRIPIIWHDLLIHYPSAWKILSPKAVIAFWYYDKDTGYPALKMLKDSGFTVIMATGLCLGALTRRRALGFHTALSEAARYDADGFMVTTWVDGRYERQKANITLSADLINGLSIPGSILDAASLITLLDKSQGDARLNRLWRAQGPKVLADSAWDRFPDYRDLLAAKFDRNTEKEKEIYLRHHQSEGPLFEGIIPKAEKNPSIPEIVLPSVRDGFCAEETNDPLTGKTIRIYNFGETFALYPDFGPLMQDWRTAEYRILPHTLPDILRRDGRQLPGSFKSFRYNGFKPMWNIGTHLNPSILWQHPWDCSILEQNSCRIKISLQQRFIHADVSFLFTITHGQPGFRCACTAMNKKENWYGTFAWNFLLDDGQGETLDTVFRWHQKKKEQTLALSACSDDAVWLPVRDTLTISRPEWQMQITTSPKHTGGYLVDWGASWMTPDIRGEYRRLTRGEVFETAWEFRHSKILSALIK